MDGNKAKRHLVTHYAHATNNTWSQTGNSVNFYLWGNDQQATFKVSASNSCGVAQEFFSFKSIRCGGDAGAPDPCNQFAVSPNPAVGNITSMFQKSLPDAMILSSSAKTHQLYLIGILHR